MATLTCITPEPEGGPWEIATEALRIGRSSENDLVVRDPFVSRFHAEIVRKSIGYHLVALDSRNPTLLNGRPVEEPHLLVAGDRITLGTTTLAFDAPDESAVRIVDTPVTRATTVSAELPARSRARAVLSAILDADQGRSLDRPLADILGVVLDLARQAIPFDRGVLLLKRFGGLVPMVVLPPRGAGGAPLEVSRGILDRALREGTSLLTEDALADERLTGHQSIARDHIRSAMCVPILRGGAPVGAIYVDSQRETRLFTESDLEILGRMGELASWKMDCVHNFQRAVEADRLRRELEVAWDLQKSMLPAERPRIEGYEFRARTRPCLEVGGDAYDYVTFSDRRRGFTLVDAAGHGIDASLLMAYHQASLRALSGLDLPPAETCRRLNTLLHARIPSNRFITLFYGVLDPARQTLTWVNAGQPAPVLIGARGATTFLERTGMPLGILPDADFEERSTPFDPGAVLVCFSDGLPDVCDRRGEPFGAARLVDLAVALRREPPAEIIHQVLAAVENHAEGGPLIEDDLTIMVIQRRPQEGGEPCSRSRPVKRGR